MSKRLVTSMVLGLTVALGCVAPALADSRKVVTLGADLSQEQQQRMLRYFGVNENQVDIIWIDNDDEREHLGAYVPLEQIGTRTFSCALVSPTRTGGIQVKTANLNWVTCNMIASTLSTSGVKNCQVVAASPFEVSGTGALTGVIMAYEEAMGRPQPQKNVEEPEVMYEDEVIVLEPVKVQLANEELVTTATLSDEIGPSKATAVINATKIEVIENNITDITEITNIVNNVSETYNVEISDDQSEQIAELMAKIAEQDYDITQLKATLERVQANVAADAGASEEVQKELEAAAAAAEADALEALEMEAFESGEEFIMDEEDDDYVNILDFTDITALEEDGVAVIEGDTTSSVADQEEESGRVVAADDDDDEVIFDDDDDDDDEFIFDDDDEIDDDDEVEPAEEKLTKDDLDLDDVEIYEDIEDGLKDVFLDDQVINDFDDVVFLTGNAAKDFQKALNAYVLEVLVNGADEVAAKEAKNDKISKNILAETAGMVPVAEYDDEDLTQIDKFVRRAVLMDSEKLFKDCDLTEYEVVVIYDEVMKVIEEAFGVESDEVVLDEEELEVDAEVESVDDAEDDDDDWEEEEFDFSDFDFSDFGEEEEYFE